MLASSATVRRALILFARGGDAHNSRRCGKTATVAVNVAVELGSYRRPFRTQGGRINQGLSARTGNGSWRHELAGPFYSSCWRETHYLTGMQRLDLENQIPEWNPCLFSMRVWFCLSVCVCTCVCLHACVDVCVCVRIVCVCVLVGCRIYGIGSNWQSCLL